jgi:hypothetical protein
MKHLYSLDAYCYLLGLLHPLIASTAGQQLSTSGVRTKNPVFTDINKTWK